MRMFVVCCLLFVVCCFLFVVWSLFDARCSLFVSLCSSCVVCDCDVLCVVWCSLYVVPGLVFADRC